MDKRTDRVQPVRLQSGFFPCDISKSMFINDLMITIPKYYAESWGKDILDKHSESNFSWEVELDYETPKEAGREKRKIKAHLFLSFIKNRSKESSYRLKWNTDFAVQLAKDYPKSFVRSLEFHIGDDYYKDLRYTEFDIGGFKEQLQIQIKWEEEKPIVRVKELFRVRKESQLFPNIFNQLSTYLIADYLLGDEEETLRRVQTTGWQNRMDIAKEINENNIYLLANRESKEVYIGETKKSLSTRYPVSQPHHTFDEWNEFCVIQLPPETNNRTRLLIERVLIAAGARIFPNSLNEKNPLMQGDNSWSLRNKKKQ